MQFGKVNIVKNLDHGSDARQKLISGIDKLTDAVGSTLGASGRTVVLEDDFGNPHVTKDGVTVAKYIVLEDPVENLGVMMARQASANTATRAGDGTTTSTVIAHALIHSYMKNSGNGNFRDIQSGVKKGMNAAISYLENQSIEVNEKSLKEVSTISVNGDESLGSLIAEAFSQAGENGIVTVEKNDSSETYVDSVEGTHIGGTCKTPHFFTNKEKEVAELEKPLVFLSASEIPNIRKIQDILEHAIKSNRSILLIAPLEQQPLAALAMNKAKGNIKVNVIDPPSFGQKRLDILEDLALLTGATVVDESLGDSLDLISPDVLGSALKAITDSDGTTLVFDEKTEGVDDVINNLKEILNSEDHHTLSKHLEQRLAILSGGVSILKVGADTDVELKEKLDRVDDAVAAVRAAKKEGILPGGGSALYVYARNSDVVELSSGEVLGWRIFTDAIQAPLHRILSNAGITKSPGSLLWGDGIDVIDGKRKDMIKAGIIDPVLVTKEALRNAVSVALTILSTDAVVSNIRE